MQQDELLPVLKYAMIKTLKRQKRMDVNTIDQGTACLDLIES